MNPETLRLVMSELGKKSWAARKAKMGKNVSKTMAKYGALKGKNRKKLSTA